ncbi:hypothetical protein Q5752_000701 [Cryptotrichosporon argae]
MRIPFYRPSPAPPTAFQDEPLPELRAGWLSRALFHWVTPVLRVGYSRPLQADDLWDLPPELQCQNIADELETHYLARLPPSLRSSEGGSCNVPPRRPAPATQTVSRLDARRTTIMDVVEGMEAGLGGHAGHGDAEPDGVSQRFPAGSDLVSASSATLVSPPLSSVADAGEPGSELVRKFGHRKAKQIAEGKMAVEDGKAYDMSLLRAMYQTVWKRWWLGVVLKGAGACLQVTAPLVTQLIISQLDRAHMYHAARASGSSTTGLARPQSVGYGVGLAFGLFGMETSASLFIYQAQQVGSVIGFMMRSALIDLIGRKSMRLSARSKVDMTNGRLTTMMSADASYLDFSGPMTLDLVVQPVQIVIGVGLLLYTMGYSALVGLVVLCLAGPLQSFMFVQMVRARQAQVAVIDDRVRLLSEVVGNIRAVKLYAYEALFGAKVAALRRAELGALRRNGRNRATMTASMSFIPILAAVLTFITYGLTGHTLDAATIFSALQYFNVLQTPISYLPIALTGLSDAAVAVGRLGVLLRADELPRELTIEPTLGWGVVARGDFEYEAARASDEAGANEKQVTASFVLREIDLRVSRGALVCVVGRVGTGKTALLNGLINEMRQTRGHVVFGGTVSYVPQQAWVMAGSVLDNITFASDTTAIDHARVEVVVDACGLRADLDLWPDGLMTSVGEKGITLSGGQRQRICLARAAYSRTDVVLLDDPLSAVDAGVGQHLVRHCILSGPLAHRTRVLVTHQLDVLPHADVVLVMDTNRANEGRIIQQGTYAQLASQTGPFQTLMREHGGQTATTHAGALAEVPAPQPRAMTAGAKLMLDEEREVGAVDWRVYASYLRAMGSWVWPALFLGLLLLNQLSTVATSLVLGWWSSSALPLSQGTYMAVYASLGLSIAAFTFAASYTMFLAGLRASFALFNGAWDRVMHAPVAWHDRTPAGRIINRLSEDVEVVDDRVSQVYTQLLMNALDVLGTFGLVVYTYPYLGLAFVPLAVLFYLCASFYRQTSREVKRIDSIARSGIYTSFGEQLSGLSVIRAFGRQSAFERKLQHAVNEECKAYIVTLTIQRWLGVRLDFYSNALVLLIAIFGTLERNTINPSKLGVVLTYTLSTASVFSNLVSLYAQVEQEMNTVERIQHYNDLAVESTSARATDPGPAWPHAGEIAFDNVQLRYRPELPLVLKDLSFKIRPGEKVGIIGRTGAGKSSIAQALFRTVELAGGRIAIDGVDMSTVSLGTLRSRLSIIPQEAFVFEGTVRDNMDPPHAHDDAALDGVLDLVRRGAGTSRALCDKLRLDGRVAADGANFSAGEKQLLALLRALVRGSKVLVLDEATSSVDAETDALIQRVIPSGFADVTLVSIAHRLQTVAYYDRILVMDAGRVAEFDHPLVLFDRRDSVFRSLCDKINLRRVDILRIRQDAQHAAQDARHAHELAEHFRLANKWQNTRQTFWARLSVLSRSRANVETSTST